MASKDKIPPQALDAEKAVLGSMMIEDEAIDKALELLDDGSFYHPPHRTLFAAIAGLHRDGKAVDLVTVKEALSAQGALKDVGGVTYLSELLGSVTTAAHVDDYARIVKDKAVTRDLIRTATDIVARAYDGEQEPGILLDEAQSRILAISQKQTVHSFQTSEKLAHEVVEHLESLSARKDHLLGVPTGFADLDRLTSGFQPSNLIIIAARPGQGKTSLALNIAAAAATHRKKPTAVGFFSLEMSARDIYMRLLCSEAEVDLHKTRSGYFSREDWPRLTSVSVKLAEAPIYIDDTPGLSVMEMRSRTRRLASDLRSKGKELGMVIVDYLQLMRGDYLSRKEGRQQEVAEISRQLKSLARDLNIPVVALSQLNRSVEEKGREGRPQLSDLRESGAIEQDADLVSFIYREGQYRRDDPTLERVAELIVAKHRNGPTDTVKMQYRREFTRFYPANAETEAAAPQPAEAESFL